MTMQLVGSPNIPLLGAPAKVLGMTIIVVVECQQCNSKEQIALVNAQPAVCPGCSALLAMDRVQWDKHNPTPKIAISASPKPIHQKLD